MQQSKLKHSILTTVSIKNGFLSGGFTLVEMLVSIVISSLIFVSSYQVISNLIQYQVKARVHNNEELDRSLTLNLISQIIEKSIHPYDLVYRIPKAIGLSVGKHSLQLISRAYSTNHDSPGHRVYELYLHNGELFVSHRKYDESYLANQQFDISTGLKIKALNFQYLMDEQWIDDWSDQSSLPEYIKVDIEHGNSDRQVFVRETGSG